MALRRTIQFIFWVLTGVVSSLPTFASPLTHEERLRGLENARTVYRRLIDRIENGKAPCFDDSCQTEKSRLASEIFIQSSTLPQTESVFLTTRKAGIWSAHSLITNRFTPPAMKGHFPSSLSEWVAWWKLRHSHEYKFKSQWLSFSSEAYALEDALKIYVKQLERSDEDLKIIQEAWDRGLPVAAKNMVESSLLMRQVSILEDQKRDAEAKPLRERAYKLSMEIGEIEKRFGNQFRAVLGHLFPGLSFKQVLAFSVVMDKWLQLHNTHQLFDEDLIEELPYRASEVTKLVNFIRDFNDLEYGVVGIKNFHTPVNPSVALETALPISEFLDIFEEEIRDNASLYFLLASGDVMMGAKGIAKMALPTVFSILRIEGVFDLNEFIWPIPPTTDQIKSQKSRLEENMQRRLPELIRTRDIFRRDLNLIEQKIEQLRLEPLRAEPQQQGASE